MGRKGSSLTNEERFWRLVDTSTGPDGCWLWMGSYTGNGYGSFKKRLTDGTYQTVRAHRFAHEMAVGPIPNGINVLHACDCRKCVNQKHLSSGTQLENLYDANQKGRSYRRWLANEVVARIKELFASGISQAAIAKELAVSRSVVYHIARGKRRAKEVFSTTTHEATKKASTSPAKVQSMPS